MSRRKETKQTWVPSSIRTWTSHSELSSLKLDHARFNASEGQLNLHDLYFHSEEPAYIHTFVLDQESKLYLKTHHVLSVNADREFFRETSHISADIRTATDITSARFHAFPTLDLKLPTERLFRFVQKHPVPSIIVARIELASSLRFKL